MESNTPQEARDVFGINADDIPHQELNDLRLRLGCPDSGESKDIYLYKRINQYISTFISEERIAGRQLFRLQEKLHRDGLIQMVNDFLDAEGNGARFWPSDATDKHYRKMTYAEHSLKIKQLLIQIFWKINYLRVRDSQVEISPRRPPKNPKQTASASSLTQSSSSNNVQTGINASEPICVDNVGSGPNSSADSVTTRAVNNRDETSSVHPRPRSSTFEPNEITSNDYDIQDTSEGLGTPRRSIPRAPEAPMAESNVEASSPARISPAKRTRGKAKRTAPVLGRKSETTRAKRAKQQTSGIATIVSPISATIDPTDGPAIDSSAEPSGPVPNHTRQRARTQHPGMVSWENAASLIMDDQSPVPRAGPEDRQPLIRLSNRQRRSAFHLQTPPPNLSEDTIETTRGQTEHVTIQPSLENEAQSTLRRPSPASNPEFDDEQRQMAIPTLEVEPIPVHQLEPEAQPTHTRGSSEPKRSIETPSQAIDQVPARGSGSVIKRAADPEPPSPCHNSTADQNGQGQMELDPIFRVEVAPKRRRTWSMQGSFLPMTLIEFMDELPIQGNFSGISFTLVVLGGHWEDYIPANDEKKFRKMKAWFQEALESASEQLGNESVLTFEVRIRPNWVGETQGQTEEILMNKRIPHW